MHEFYTTTTLSVYGTFITKKKGGGTKRDHNPCDLFYAFENDLLNIQIPDALCVGLDKLLSRVHRIAHQHVKGSIRFGGVFHRDDHQ